MQVLLVQIPFAVARCRVKPVTGANIVSVPAMQQGMRKMLAEFRAFIMKGNVLDLAVAVIIGAAFGAIVSSLTDDLIMPLIGAVTGGLDFSSKFVALGPIPATYTGSLTDYAALKKAGVPLFGYGKFLTTVLNFLIVGFVIFLAVRQANRMMAKPAPEAAPAGPTPSEALLAEIRDEFGRDPKFLPVPGSN